MKIANKEIKIAKKVWIVLTLIIVLGTIYIIEAIVGLKVLSK